MLSPYFLQNLIGFGSHKRKMFFLHLVKMLVIVLVITHPFDVTAQKGHYFLRHYSPTLLNVDHHNYDIAQDENGLMCFANRKGVLKFNGSEWQLIKTPSSALALELNAQDQRLYVGCSNDFGFIERDEKGVDQYHSIANKLEVEGDISHIEVAGNWVYFLSESYLYEYSSIEKKITNRFKAEQENPYFSLFMHDGQANLVTEEGALFHAYANELRPQNFRVPSGNYPVFAARISKHESLVGGTEGDLYRLNKEKFTPLALDDAEYLADHSVLNGLLLQDSLVVLSTLSGGVLIVNWQTGKTIGKIDYDSGLPDNEVYAIFKDEKDHLWITHDYGITLLDFTSPIEVYSSHYGLKGSILSVNQTESFLYVGTTVGLFYLEELEDITEIRRIVQEQKETARPMLLSSPSKLKNKQSSKEVKTLGKEIEEEAKPRKSKWINRLFSKRKEKKGKRKNRRQKKGDTKEFEAKELSLELENLKELDIPKEIEKEELFPTPVIPTEKTTITSSRVKVEAVKTKTGYFIFRQLEEVSGKCQQLIPYNGGLLAVTNTGMYTVSKKKVKAITTEPIRIALLSEKYDRVYASTYNDELLVFKKDGKSWEDQPVFTGFDEYISAFLEDEKGNLWVCGTDAISRMELDENGDFVKIASFEISNPYNDAIRAVNWNNHIYFLLSSGAYYYDGSTKLKLDAKLIDQSGEFHVLSNSHEVSWLHNGNDWVMLSGKNVANISTDTKLNYLKWLGELSGIFIDQDHHKLWAVTKDNRLFQLKLDDPRKIQEGYGVYLQHIRNHQNNFLSLGDFEIGRTDNEVLYFSFAMPSYLEEGNVHFQYRLNGKDKEWTAWSKNNMVSYVGLPSGKYQLSVRGKDSFGNVSEIQPINFKVVPPYWEQPWFYVAEILFFSTLLVLSYRLNRRHKKYKILRQVLTIFTLILIVEFVQVTLESMVNIKKTPVSNFAIQAGIALLVFPLERLLSYFIRQGISRKKAQEEVTEQDATSESAE